jgi:hypothetical protein
MSIISLFKLLKYYYARQGVYPAVNCTYRPLQTIKASTINIRYKKAT